MKFVGILFLLCLHQSLTYAQCGSGTPSFTVDLSNNPDSTWYSSSVMRNDTCCASGPCVEFIVTLSPDAEAITLDIYSGAMPSGSLFYYVGCGTKTTIGTPLCLSGTGRTLLHFASPATIRMFTGYIP